MTADLPLWLLPLATLLFSWLLTWAMRQYALAHSVIDVPNERSSHSVPTPRGGGVAIVLSFVVTLPVLSFAGLNSWSTVSALAGAAVIAAVLGFLDDHGHVPARWRLIGHFSAAAWALVVLGGFPPLSIPGMVIDLGWFGHIAAAVYLVWVLNLYNFMDGIDGIASIEAICVLFGGAVLYFLAGEPLLAAPLILLASAVVGFLCWNFPPAKIFMGDAGSGFLGIVLGVMSLQAAWLAPELLWSWVILLGVFIVDATYTLLRRLFRGERVYEAHCSHAYQYAARQYGSHRTITIAVLGINVLWLYPLAWLVSVGSLEGSLGLVIAYIPLCLTAIKLRAGTSEPATGAP